MDNKSLKVKSDEYLLCCRVSPFSLNVNALQVVQSYFCICPFWFISKIREIFQTILIFPQFFSIFKSNVEFTFVIDCKGQKINHSTFILVHYMIRILFINWCCTIILSCTNFNDDASKHTQVAKQPHLDTLTQAVELSRHFKYSSHAGE